MTSPESPDQTTAGFWDLPLHDRLDVLNKAVNDRDLLFPEDTGFDQLDDDGKRAALQEYSAIVVAREACFMEEEGVSTDVARQLAERIMGEGIRLGLVAHGIANEAELRRQPFDFDSLLPSS